MKMVYDIHKCVVCDYCQEEILDGERAENFGSDFHRECLLRAVLGPVGHILKRCSCYGGNEGDPEGMTVRQAAKAVLELWLKQQHEMIDSHK